MLYGVVSRFLARLLLRKYHTYNQKTRLYRCLRQLFSQIHGPRNLSIVESYLPGLMVVEPHLSELIVARLIMVESYLTRVTAVQPHLPVLIS